MPADPGKLSQRSLLEQNPAIKDDGLISSFCILKGSDNRNILFHIQHLPMHNYASMIWSLPAMFSNAIYPLNPVLTNSSRGTTGLCTGKLNIYAYMAVKMRSFPVTFNPVIISRLYQCIIMHICAGKIGSLPSVFSIKHSWMYIAKSIYYSYQ